MNGLALIGDLRQQGVSLTVEGDKLRVTAPRGALTPELRQALAEGKAEVLAILAGEKSEQSPAQLSPLPAPETSPTPAEWVRTWPYPNPIDPQAANHPEDSALWVQLLVEAWHIDGEDPHGVYGALLGARCAGAKLLQTLAGLEIKPRFQPEGLFEDQADYDAFKAKHMMPHKQTIADLLRPTAAPELEAA